MPVGFTQCAPPFGDIVRALCDGPLREDRGLVTGGGKPILEDLQLDGSDWIAAALASSPTDRLWQGEQ